MADKRLGTLHGILRDVATHDNGVLSRGVLQDIVESSTHVQSIVIGIGNSFHKYC